MQEYRLPEGAEIRSREDGQIYTVHSSNQTNNQFGYGIYFYRVKERLDSGFGLYWNWFDVVSEIQVIELLIKERDRFKECVERELENERTKFIKEHTKTVQRVLFGSFAIGDIVYYAKSYQVGTVKCDTCNNKRIVVMTLGERSFNKECPDCTNFFARTIYEYRPKRDKVAQINTTLWAVGEKMELEIWLDDRDGSSKDGDGIFLTVEECQAYCDELNKKEQEKQTAKS